VQILVRSHIFNRYRAQPAIKAAMKLIGLDCGPTRLPNKALNLTELNALKSELEQLGFLNWILEE